MHQKMSKLGPAQQRCVHKPILVVNSIHDVQTVETLLGLSPAKCLKNFHLGMAMAVKKDHRSYAQVVADKSDSNYTV